MVSLLRAQVLGAMEASSSREARRVPSERSEGHLILFIREMLPNADLLISGRLQGLVFSRPRNCMDRLIWQESGVSFASPAGRD